MRLAVSVTNSAHRKSLVPDDPYVTISEAPAWEALEKLAVNPSKIRALHLSRCLRFARSAAKRKSAAMACVQREKRGLHSRDGFADGSECCLRFERWQHISWR